MSRGDEHAQVASEGFLMDDSERRRKAAILGLISLDENWFRQEFGTKLDDCFPRELNILWDLGLLSHASGRLGLTDRGIRHRDVIVQMFFSERVRELVRSFKYDE
jgi:coproporphyrinogen III oxidase-like Fe-S oxidoreductase